MPTGKSLFWRGSKSVACDLRINRDIVGHPGREVEYRKNDEALPGTAVVLNSRTGLVGWPVQTFNGIEARCLLNPRIKAGAMIQIDQASIQKQELSTTYTQQGNNNLVPSIATDGYTSNEGHAFRWDARQRILHRHHMP